MHILLRGKDDTEEVLVSYPRELTISEGTHYSSAFLADLGPKSLRGARAHTIYPIPDSAFVWNHPVAHVSTRSKPEIKDSSAHEPVVKGSIAHEHAAKACIDHDHAAGTVEPATSPPSH